jgi:hypothetical protein
VSEKPPIGFDFAHATPFALTSASQFRPAAPPKLDSQTWVRDYNEVKTMGARNSTARTPEQTATALFWASSGPQQYVDSIAGLPLRGTTSDRARLLALAYMAMSDAGYAVFDAKYAYDSGVPSPRYATAATTATRRRSPTRSGHRSSRRRRTRNIPVRIARWRRR